MESDEQERLTRLINEHKRAVRWRNDPITYMVERLGIKRESLDWLLLEGYNDHEWDGTENPFVATANALAESKWVGIKSAVGVGKTFFGAAIALWFFENFPNSVVVTTAPKSDQLELHIWKEIGLICSRITDIGILGSLKLRMHKGKDDWIITGFVAGVKANEESTTKAQGFHAEHMLIILEETAGIPQPTINALENTSVAPHNIILALGNPDSQLDALARFCGQPNVTPIRISAYDHPNVVLNDASLIPGATSKANIERMAVKLGGEQNPMYQSRVRGIAPAQSSDSLIRLEWCYSARDKQKLMREEGKKIEGSISLGVDVANSEAGDLAAVAHGVGVNLESVKAEQCPNANTLGRQVAQMIRDENINPSLVGVDGVGVGAGTVNTLKEEGYEIYNIMSGSGMVKVFDTAEEFNNLRSQMWWELREDLRKGEIALPNDEELFADLVTPKWGPRNGKIVVESKDEIKKRLGRSPNKGDAAVYWNWARTQRVGAIFTELFEL